MSKIITHPMNHLLTCDVTSKTQDVVVYVSCQLSSDLINRAPRTCKKQKKSQSDQTKAGYPANVASILKKSSSMIRRIPTDLSVTRRNMICCCIRLNTQYDYGACTIAP